MRCQLNVTRILQRAPVGVADWVGAACFAVAAVWAAAGLTLWPGAAVEGLYWRFQLMGPRWAIGTASAVGLALWGAGILLGARPGKVRRGPVRLLSSRQQVAVSVGLRMAGAAVGWLGWAYLFWMFALHRFWSVGTITCFLLSIRDMGALFYLVWHARWTESGHWQVREREGQEEYERLRERHDMNGDQSLPKGLTKTHASARRDARCGGRDDE